MKPRWRRLRTIAFEASLAATVLLTGLWVASAFGWAYVVITPEQRFQKLGVTGYDVGRMVSVGAVEGTVAACVSWPDSAMPKLKPWSASEVHLDTSVDGPAIPRTFHARWPGIAGVTASLRDEAQGYAYVPRTLDISVSFAWPVAMAGAAAWFCRPRRAPAEGCCAACGYDLRATPGRCPECGWAAAREK